jgi:hypothetical protein
MNTEFLNPYRNKLTNWTAKPKNLWFAGAVIIALITVGYLVFNSNDDNVLTASDQPTVKIGKSIEVIARTEDGRRTTGRFDLTVTNAHFADSILVQGKRARPVKGKTFLVLDMEISNPHKVSLYAFPADLFRFVRSDGEKFAPSVHQGKVRVRPEATKKSNVAFVALPEDKKFKIEAGDINEDKITLEITF